jgi:2-polyprenyl-3-methyl-5-hydroxy-6-metoxy-1,4-benzoquinol methylase
LSFCRVCNGRLRTLLEYENMPKAAQNFPEYEDLLFEEGADLEVCECEVCNLVQLSNEPVPYHKEVIRAAAFSEEMKQFRVKQFSDFVDKYSLKGKKVIEIGCGKGEFLQLMKDAGTLAYGIEYSSNSVKFCKEQGLQVDKDYVFYAHHKLKDHPFDCFFILNFFEHIPDLNSTLEALHNNLTEDGLGIIEVPNFDMIIRENLFSEFINDHLFYFTEDTLRSVLSRNGFEVVEATQVWHDYIISVVVKKKKRLDLSTFKSHQQKITKELQEYISKFEEGSVAIYGAGHQALAMVSLAQLGDSIKYVLDDAPFKQGKYTPATHIPIVSEECLQNDPPKAIIIMAASYSDEVARKLQKLDLGISLTILRDKGLYTIV